MSRMLTLAAAVLVALAGPAFAKERAPESVADQVRERMGGIILQANGGDTTGACKQFDALEASPDLATLPEAERAKVLMVGSILMTWCNRTGDALPLARQGQALNPTANGAKLIAETAEAMELKDVVAEALLDLARRWPDEVTSVSAQQAYRTQKAYAADPARQRRFLQGLFDARFDPRDGDPSELWFELARLNLDAGDVPRAQAAAERTMGLRMAAKMRIDRRFDPVLAANPALGDVKAQATRMIEAMEAKADDYPTSLAPVQPLVEERVMLGDYAKAIALIDTTLETAGSGRDQEWTGLERRLYLAYARATANMHLGKAQQSLDDMEVGSLFVPPDAPDITRLMRADMLCDLGRADEAAPLASGDYSALPWLYKVKHVVGVCIAEQQGDLAGARKLIDALTPMLKPDDMQLRVTVLLRVGDVDAAAKDFIALLDDPATRNDTLLWAQRDKLLPETPGIVKYRKAFGAMVARPDVQAALQKHGRVLDWDVSLGLE